MTERASLSHLLQAGHYTALLRPDVNSHWHLFNDTRVAEAGASAVEAAEGMGEVGSSQSSGSNAYLLIYKRRAASGVAGEEHEGEDVGPAMELCEEVEAEEVEAARLRELEDEAGHVADLTVYAAHNVEARVTIQVCVSSPYRRSRPRPCSRIPLLLLLSPSPSPISSPSFYFLSPSQ